MNQSNLIPLTYYGSEGKIRLTNYADTVAYEEDGGRKTICAARFGGYPEAVHGMADAIYGGGTLTAEMPDGTLATLSALPKRYRRQLSHNGIYAEAAIVLTDENEFQADKPEGNEETEAEKEAAVEEENEDGGIPTDLPPRNAYLFCTPGDRRALFDAVDQKTAVPLIPEFQDYILSELEQRGDLQRLTVCSNAPPFDVWRLRCTNQDENIASVVEDGLKSGDIVIPGSTPGPSALDKVYTVTQYLNTFGAALADRIKNMFVPLFDPATEPLSPEILAINKSITEKAGYSLYDAQLAVAESIKRQLDRQKVGLIVAECGSGKTKIGLTAMAALWGLKANQDRRGRGKTFNVILCPSHMRDKWVREIEESLPDTFARSVNSITEFEWVRQLYEQGDRSCYVVINKERARDGYMRQPAVTWDWRKNGFVCPDCGEPVMMNMEGYFVNADQFYFKRENRKNHKCASCGAPLWTAINPDRTTGEWIKLGEYGFIHRHMAAEHFDKVPNAVTKDKLRKIADDPDGYYPTAGARRAYPLSSYIKNHCKGLVDGLIIDELHQYALNSGQGDAMNDLVQAARKVVGMTATLINGYSSGIFYLLFRLCAPLMKKDGRDYAVPNDFNKEYGVIQEVYEIDDADYHSNRRSSIHKTKTRLLPGVSPMVYSRFLLEYASFLSLSDMGKDLPEYVELPVPLKVPSEVEKEYQNLERTLKDFMKTHPKTAQKILSAYMNLLVAYPDQPYGHPPVVDPYDGGTIVTPRDTSSYDALRPKEEKVLEIVRRKAAAGERVMIYTNWTRLDTQKKLKELLQKEGFRTDILHPKVKPLLREKWVEDHLASGLQVLITNPSLVETGLDLNAFTTLIFYDTGYKLFTLRQASRRSWRINQTAPRVEVYMLYYISTMQHKAMKLMASKLAVAGVVEGNCFTDEGLAAMSECEDMSTLMAKELALGIKDSVEDINTAFQRMAFLKPAQPNGEKGPAEKNEPATLPPATVFQKPKEAYELGQTLAEWSVNRNLTTIKKPKKKHDPGMLDGQVDLFSIPA